MGSRPIGPVMDIRSALELGRSQLASISSNSYLDARLLLSHVTGKPSTYLISHGEEHLKQEQEAQYRQLLAQAAVHTPVPYLIGAAPFFGRSFEVSPAVLIPRPETEELVQHALAWLEKRPSARVVDVGTGSGCIAVTLACAYPQLAMLAVDVSSQALEIARRNARRHGVAHSIHFALGHLLEVVESPADLIIANLPYVTEEEWPQLDASVRHHEPSLALRGGPLGLDLIEELLSTAPGQLRRGGSIMLEIGWQQGEAVAQLAGKAFPQARVLLHSDLAGHDRIILIHS